jgi:hypothetical protein
VFVVPNRAGLWSRTDATPFGFGRPYTMGQLETVLRGHRFVIERGHSTLYQPPSVRKLWRRVGGMMEQAGRHLPVLAAGGVLMVEVSKQVAQPTRGLAVGERRRKVLDAFPVPATRGAAQPRVQVASARRSKSSEGREGS